MGDCVEKRKRLPVSVSAAVFIEDANGKLLLLQQASEAKGNKWGPPAGGMELHEDPLGNGIRETFEEIGVKVTLIDIISINTIDRGDETGIGFTFRGKIVSGEILPKKGEIADYNFFSREDIAQLITDGKLYKPEYNLPCINDWLAGRSFPIDVIRRI